MWESYTGKLALVTKPLSDSSVHWTKYDEHPTKTGRSWLSHALIIKPIAVKVPAFSSTSNTNIVNELSSILVVIFFKLTKAEIIINWPEVTLIRRYGFYATTLISSFLIYVYPIIIRNILCGERYSQYSYHRCKQSQLRSWLFTSCGLTVPLTHWSCLFMKEWE